MPVMDGYEATLAIRNGAVCLICRYSANWVATADTATDRIGVCYRSSNQTSTTQQRRSIIVPLFHHCLTHNEVKTPSFND
jgi:hypothetical protein